MLLMDAITAVEELRAIFIWKNLHKPVHPRDKTKESYDVKECYRFLELTSRSFVAVCQELDTELLMPVIIFYLALRALDTIEDDMTLRIEVKEPLLRNFYTHLHDTNWTFDGSGPNEKDREVLVRFDCVAREFNRLEEEYRVIIKDIVNGMGNGMADYAEVADKDPSGISVKTVKDYELYCHYVAGLVGEGLTRLFVEADSVDSAPLLENPEPMESMGQLLQHTNIIRDVREDYDDKRYFWPEEVWSKYVESFSDLFLPQNRERALHCSSEMVLMALRRAEDCLFYMAGVKNQPTFNFVAIPQAMAIATLELCFQNPALFERNIKISRGSACQIMVKSTQDLQSVCEVFRRYAKRILQKNNPSDPHYLEINIACGKIEQFFESRFPGAARKKIQEKEAMERVMLVVILMLGVIVAVIVGPGFRSKAE